jgi:hypothetical protein
LVPNCNGTHNPHSTFNVLLAHNIYNFSDVESDIEDEGHWHNEPTSKETGCHPIRASEPVIIEVCSTQVDNSSLTWIFIIIESFMGGIQDFVSQTWQPEYRSKQ